MLSVRHAVVLMSLLVLTTFCSSSSDRPDADEREVTLDSSEQGDSADQRNASDDRSEAEPSEISDSAALDVLEPELPMFERGLISAPDSLPCTTNTGETTYQCNHHGSSVAVTKGGTVLAVWYHGLGEYSPDSRLVWSQKAPGQEWSAVNVLFDEPDIPEGNPVVWVDENDQIFVFFVTVEGSSWNDGIIRLIKSADLGSSFSDAVTLRNKWNWMTRNHPIRMSNGELLLPCYDESLYMPTWLISNDDFSEAWVETGNKDDPVYLIEHMAQIQPTVIERKDGSLWALQRNTGSVNNWAVEMESHDFGRTWTKGTPSQVPNDNTGIEMARLSSGRIVLVFNNTFSGRYPLSVALSEDDGRTWQWVADLDGPCEGGGCSHGYTSVAQDPTDHSIWATYTHNRQTIGWVHFNESWLMQQSGSFVSE